MESMGQTYSRLASVITDGVRSGKEQIMSKWVEIKLIREGKAPALAVRCPRCCHIPRWLSSPILPTNSGNLNYCPHCGMNMKGIEDENVDVL